MDIRVEQGCPQCGAAVVLSETDHLLVCPFCGSRNYLQANGPSRYVLPMAGGVSSNGLLLAPYLRFKGTIYLVTDQGIDHRVIDTTQAANPVPGLPPSLGLRPQAMELRRIDPETGNRYLPQSIGANAILEKAAAVGNLVTPGGEGFHHRAYIGENLSYIYLPLVARDHGLYDGVTDSRLADLAELAGHPLQGRRYDEAWRVRFLATLCPQCGAGLQGEGDCQVMTCANCQTAWSFGAEGLSRVDWWLQPGDSTIPLYLPFWKVTAHIPALSIYSFADFVERTNQPFLPRPSWRERAMSLWIPAVKLRPKIFLQAARQATLGQWRIKPLAGRVLPQLFPVTLAASEARQAVKLVLAAATASPKRIYPFLPQVRLTGVMIQLVYLPCVDKSHDWVQPDTGITIGKNILRFGRSL
jgi:ribosomal protein S27AE